MCICDQKTASQLAVAKPCQLLSCDTKVSSAWDQVPHDKCAFHPPPPPQKKIVYYFRLETILFGTIPATSGQPSFSSQWRFREEMRS